MSVLVPLNSAGITLTEVPDKIAVYFELANCNAKCDGCHSPHLWKKPKHYTPMEDLEAYADRMINEGANAIVIMGGTTNGMHKAALECLINNLSMIAPVCLYSGSDDIKGDLELALSTGLTWLKTGSYKATLGGLDKSTTNQQFWQKDYHITISLDDDVSCTPEMIDMTYFFQNHNNGEIK